MGRAGVGVGVGDGDGGDGGAGGGGTVIRELCNILLSWRTCRLCCLLLLLLLLFLLYLFARLRLSACERRRTIRTIG